MSHNNGKIAAPVSIYDVQQVIGNSSPDLGTLCVANSINKWARYKPERAAGPMPLSHGTTDQVRTRKANHFGLTIPYCVDAIMSDLAHEVLIREASAWDYLKPRGDRSGSGGVKEFYRLTDFVRIPNDATDTNPSSAQGYNQNAGLPFKAEVIMDGITEKTDANGKYYEVNKQIASTIRIVFTNSSVDGDDLHLQDLVDLNGSYGTGIAWRPMVQVYKENIYGTEDRWWLSSLGLETGGPAIDADLNIPAEVTIDLSDSLFTQNPNAAFHVCLGVGCCTQDGSSYYSNDSLFLLPYTDTRQSVSEWLQFYFRFKLVSNPGRRITFTNLKYFNSSNQWVDAGGSAPYFEIPKAFMQGTTVGLTFSITKLPTQAVDFVGENGTSSYPTLKLQARESLNYGPETTKYLTPANPNNNWATVSNIFVPTGQTTETQNLYAWIYIDKQNANVGDVLVYHLLAKISSDEWNEIGYFSIKMT